MTTIDLKNAHLAKLDVDHLYHLGLSTADDLKGMFGDTKFVCMGGSATRAEKIAHHLRDVLDLPDAEVKPIGKTERYSLFKVGCVISVNHGMGMPSMSILLHELTKLLHYAGATDVTMFRIGTSGGIGVEGGTVVVASGTLSGTLEPYYELPVLGETRKYEALVDKDLAKEILECGKAEGDLPEIKAVNGFTVGTNCFYEGQGRLDGAICDYDEEDQQRFLRKAHEKGVRNFEMESTVFAAFTHRLGIRAALVNVALLNRLNGDQIKSTPEELSGFSFQSQLLVFRFIRKSLGLSPKM